MNDNKDKKELNREDEEKYRKQIDKRRKNNKILGIVLLVCISSIFIGTSFGVGFGLASKFFDRFINKSNSEEKFIFDKEKEVNRPEENLSKIISCRVKAKICKI